MSERDEDSSRLGRWALVSQATLVLASVLAVVVSVLDLTTFSVSAGALALGVFVVAYLAAGVAALRYMTRTRTFDLRVALTGQPRAGKTVMANIVFDTLMSGSDQFGFTADQKSAISVHQVLRGMAENQWPAKTAPGSVLVYKGLAEFGRRIRVDLEIGDSAGEHWIDLRSEGSEAAEYLEYVISADALVHVVSAEQLTRDPSLLERDLEDLRIASQLMRSTRRKRGPLGPLIIAMSHIDLLAKDSLDTTSLLTLSSPERAKDNSNSQFLPGAALEDLEAISQRLTREFASVSITFTSHLAVTGRGRLRQDSPPDIVEWLGSAAIDGPGGERPTLLRLLSRAVTGR